MRFTEFLALYGITEKDLERFPSLQSRFPPDFKRNFGRLVRDFILRNLPDSAAIISRNVTPAAFEGTIEKMLNLLLTHPKEVGVYLDAVVQTHLDADVKVHEFMSTYAKFYREIMWHLNIQEEEILKKFLLFVCLSGTYMLIQQVKRMTLPKGKDPITGLPSKRPFIIRFREYVEKYKNLILLDVDRFSEINLYHGYSAGNAVLAVMASMLRDGFPDSHIVRLHNDEFLIMTKDDADEALKKLNLMAEELQKHLVVFTPRHGELPNLGFSAVIIGTELCRGLDFEFVAWIAYESLKSARELRASAKEIVSEDMFRTLLERKNMLRQAMQAIYRRSATVAVQRIVDAFSGDTVFCEILARLIFPSGEVISAGHFIDLISNSSLEAELDKIIVGKVLETTSSSFPFKVSVNVSHLFLQKNFSWFVERLQESNLPVENLMLELSERGGIIERAEIKNRLRVLKKMGVSIAIDDFGIRYSNYYILKSLEVDGIKIDGSVVRDICNNRLDRIFVEGIIRLAKEKGIFVVAEYVENEEIANLLRKIATKSDFHRLYFQGYYIEKPKLFTELKAS